MTTVITRKTPLALVVSAIAVLALCSVTTSPAQAPEIIIVQDMERDSLLQAAGYPMVVESIAKHFSPLQVTDQQFEEKLKTISALRTRIFALNIFLPGSIKVVGPQVDEAAILRYADIVFRRCKMANVGMVVWGSSGSRRLPEGFDRAAAEQQFISITRQVAGVAARYGIMVALENLNHTETNFINKVEDAARIVRAVKHPNFKLCVDIYHMLVEDEQPSIISTTGDIIVHCDIAEKVGRTPPGTNGDDFTPYLRELKAIGYNKMITLECNWRNIENQAGPARLELKKQLDSVYR